MEKEALQATERPTLGHQPALGAQQRGADVLALAGLQQSVMPPRLEPGIVQAAQAFRLRRVAVGALQQSHLQAVLAGADLEIAAVVQALAVDGPWLPATTPQGIAEHWWRLYQDPQLDDLQQRLLRANSDLAAALAHYDAAQAYSSQLHAGLFPQISASAQPLHQHQSDNRPLRGSTQPSIYNSNTAGFALSFDLDLWGGFAIKRRPETPRPKPPATTW